MDAQTPTTEADLIPLARSMGEALAKAGLLAASAESCTGGLVGHLITEIPGSSAWFLGCAGVYSNAAKERLLGVQHETLLAHGAVSAQVAQQMAQGALSLYGADVVVSITGIAGPGGGTAEKPSGLVHLHLSATGGTERAERVVWTLDRRGNKLLSAQLALQMLLEFAEKQEMSPLQKAKNRVFETGSLLGIKAISTKNSVFSLESEILS